ncbi:MAG: hypothetical protein IAF02_23300 [Anaerolineae bacterium]|nr:hypothetical protein [Anaerolineae bacterium]
MDQKVFWIALSIVSLIMTILWYFIWPVEKGVDQSGISYFIIRWGHLITWLFILIGSLLKLYEPDKNTISTLFFQAGGISYLLFILVTYVFN